MRARTPVQVAAAACLSLAACAPAAHPPSTPAATVTGSQPLAPEPRPELARFMRELVNVPFSFAVLEHDGERRPVHVRRAATVLHGAVRDLAGWRELSVGDPEARAVFFEYAWHLERQVADLEEATRAGDGADAGVHLAAIRRTCESCHRFFRPAAILEAAAGAPVTRLRGAAR